MVHFRGNTLRAPTCTYAREISTPVPKASRHYRDVAQLVARTAGGREAAGSSPVIPTSVNKIMAF
jgi:hypothetical protein